MVKRMTARELDVAAARLEQIELEEEKLRSQLREQVEEFGSTPPRAEKSKRLAGTLYRFTLSHSVITELKDAEVERMKKVCPGPLFYRLFRTITKFKLAEDAARVLASPLPPGAPRNLRMMFHNAVITKESAPRLRIEKIEGCESEECAMQTAVN